jgi:hypothetical protein
MARRPRYAPHPDENQGEIVDALRACGFLVVNVSRWLPLPDLFVWGWDQAHSCTRWTAWEIKTDVGKLTKVQRDLMGRDAETVLREYGRI